MTSTPPLPTPVKTESRTCFGIAYFTDEQDAQAYSAGIKARNQVYNGGFFDGLPCGRDTSFDHWDSATGLRFYAVTTA